jgi:chromosomal replication initiation ATPase DnaA
MNAVERIVADAEGKLTAIYNKPVKLAVMPLTGINDDEKLKFVTLVVCNALNINFDELFKHTRPNHIAEARMFVFYYAKNYYGVKNMNKHKRYFQLKCHSTVIHGIRTIKERLEYGDEKTTMNKQLIDAEFQDILQLEQTH